MVTYIASILTCVAISYVILRHDKRLHSFWPGMGISLTLLGLIWTIGQAIGFVFFHPIFIFVTMVGGGTILLWRAFD